MKKKKRRRRWIIGLLSALALVITVTLLISVFSQVRARFSRPLVMIHNPINRQVITLDDSVMVHATARNERGITRAELWADGELIAEKENPDGDAINPFVLLSSWQPTTLGNHILIVRAFAADGTEGQATVTVEVIEREVKDTHEVQEGESLESIAEEYGTTEEELEELNPDLPEEGPAPGDELEVPGGGGEEGSDRAETETEDTEEEGAGEEEGEDRDGGDAPPPHPESPGGIELGDWFFGLDLDDLFDFSDSSSLLIVEVLSFSLGSSDFEDVHCYVSLGDTPWFSIWDALNMSTGVMTSLESPPEEPLQLVSRCEGIFPGGTASDYLGMINLSIPPSQWDNVIREETSEGRYGPLSITYRVGYEEEREANLDPDMTPPTNLYLDPMRYALRWEYHPRAEEAPIDGFRIYLNNTLQWVEPADARASDLPPEWFRPPCGETYTFTVTAYRGISADATESAPTDPPVVIEDEDDCQKEFMVTFLTLQTFDLPSDGRYEDRTGDLGPVYGQFVANEEWETFRTGRLLRGAGVDTAMGITQNTIYDLAEFAEGTDRSWSGLPVTYVDVPEEDVLTVGFSIHDDDLRNDDDLLCEAEAQHFNGPTAELDRVQEYALRSENGRCEITYTIGPAPGSAVGSADTAYPPLPWLEVENIRYDDEQSRYLVDIRNTGTATWPYRTLTVNMVTRDGETVEILVWDEFGLEPNATETLVIPDHGTHAPMELCPFLDPHNEVDELLESQGTRRHIPQCAPLPDLVITDVDYMEGSNDRLRVTFQNQGEGTLENRVVGLTTTLADGSPAYLSRSQPNIHLEPGETIFIELSGISEGIYEQLLGGYSVTIDPDEIITESNEGNNDYTVPASVTVRFIPEEFFSERSGENLLQCRAEAYFRIEIGHGHTLDDAEWVSYRYPESGELVFLVDHFICAGDDPGPWIPGEEYHREIQMPNDENLYIRLSGWERDGSVGARDSLGEIFRTYTPEDNYGEGSTGWTWSTEGSCNDARPYGTPKFQARWRIEIIE